ncbi:hypothetical protein UFOVP1236_24 [uncultured Caudovirales phage]|uniref:Uncharacterized protein n=1 Tax=uncultured Caudovirales phage TaxID=2100421 RepID=A0A6J5RFG1_9CAUD|nr:hypothetical protein UFOVP1236_24 [uncultured Caudovirales phage]
MAVDQKDKCGALWIKSSRGGVEFMSGEIELAGVKHRITVFRNGFKTETNKQPNYQIYRDTGAPAPGASAAPAYTAPPPPAPAREELPSIDLNADREEFRGPDRW